MIILDNIRNLVGGPVFIFGMFLAIIFGFVVFLNICTLIRNLVIKHKARKLHRTSYDLNDPLNKYFSQFKRHLESLHLSIDTLNSTVESGLLQDKITLQIVGNYKYIDGPSSGSECGIYIYTFNSKHSRLGSGEFKFILKSFNEESFSKQDQLVKESSTIENVTEVSKFRVDEKNFFQKKSSKVMSTIALSNYSIDVFGSPQKSLSALVEASCIEIMENHLHLEREMAIFSGRNAKKTSHKYLHGNGIHPHQDLVIAKKYYRLPEDDTSKNILKSKDANNMEIHKGDLIIPIRNLQGTLISYQVVTMKSKTHFRKGLSIKGGCYVIGGVVNDNINEYILCEDYATANLLNRITGRIAIACFDIQNIFEIAKQIKFICPNSNFIFATSRDLQSKNKIKITKAFDYALHFKASFVFPKFPEEKRFEHFKTWVELRKFLNDEDLLKIFTEQLDFFNGRNTADVVSYVAARYNIP